MIAVLAFYVGEIADSVLVAINKIGSLLNGPLLALFLVAAFAPRVGEGAALTGLFGGIALNGLLWLGAPGVSWLWWNVFGCLGTLALALLLARMPLRVAGAAEASPSRPPSGGRRLALILTGYSVGIGLLCAAGSLL